MIQNIYILFYLGFLLCFFSCQKEVSKEWVYTQNEGLYIWTNIDDQSYIYNWDGDSFDKLIHGLGTLSIYKNDSLIVRKKLTAHYGATTIADVETLSDGSTYIGNIQSGLFEGFGVYIKGPDMYIGSFTESKPNGSMNWYRNKTLYYKGEWRNGNFQGEGILYKEDGSDKKGIWENGRLIQTYCEERTSEGLYEGYILNGKPNGFGIMHYNDKSCYTGEWSNGKYNGKGTFSSEQDSIIGRWEEGILNDYAIYKTDNFFYKGDWSNNKPDGIGSLQLKDSTFFYGYWSEGKRNGFGDILFANKDTYTGNWVSNTFEGEGLYKYANTGDYYEGEWKNGVQHGYGLYKSAEFEYIGNWEEGWINDKGYINYANGDFYEGNFVENKRFGIGFYQFNNGNTYEGEFVDGVFNGLGIFRFIDGNIYEGEFKNGKIKGDGTLYYVENGENIAITSNWDGTNQFPKQASILFGNGDLYEGELINGFPTKDGTWTTAEERKKGEFINSITKANEFYKRHKDSWNAFVKYTSIALTVVEIAAPIVGIITIPIGGGALIPVGKYAGIANIALNSADAMVATASTGVDVYNASNEGKDEVLKNLGKELAINATFILAPRLLKSNYARKAKVLLSSSAKNVGKQAKTSIVKLNKNKAFGNTIRIGKDETGQLQMIVQKSIATQAIKNTSSSINKKFQSTLLKTSLPRTLIYNELNKIRSKGHINLKNKEFSYLMSNADKANLKSFIKTYTGNENNYLEFFIRLANGNKQQATMLLNQPRIKAYIDKSIRTASGEAGYHEWLMTKNFKSFLLDEKWGKDGHFLTIAQSKLIQKTRNINFRGGSGHVSSGRPNSSESVKFHEGLARVIEQSKSKEDLFINIRAYAKKTLDTDSYKEFIEIFKSVLQTRAN